MSSLPSLAELIDLSGKGAIVTGAAQGFGFACAQRLAEAGASVLMLDRRAEALDPAVARLTEAGHRAAALVGDVTEEDDVKRAVSATYEQFGCLDVLVNNAGVRSNVLIEHLDEEELLRFIRTGLF